MRIRSTKPEFWRSERIASVSWDARLVLKGLESYVDDNGVGKDDVALIVGDVFPRDMVANPRDTLARVSEAISALQNAGLLHRYEVDGTHLLYVAFWESVQRIDKPGKGRFPRPDGTFAYGESEIRESVASPRESVAPGTGEQGNRGTGEQSPPNGGEARKRAPRGTRIPDDFTVTPEMAAWARTNCPNVDGRRATQMFINYWRAKTGRDATKLDWLATWQNWLLKDQGDAHRTAAPRPTRDDDNFALVAELAAEEHTRMEITA